MPVIVNQIHHGAENGLFFFFFFRKEEIISPVFVGFLAFCDSLAKLALLFYLGDCFENMVQDMQDNAVKNIKGVSKVIKRLLAVSA